MDKIIFKNTQFTPMTTEEINMLRMKAYLDFGETDMVQDLKLQGHEFPTCQYLNLKGNVVNGKILIERKNGEIIVENENGCYICLTKEKLI